MRVSVVVVHFARRTKPPNSESASHYVPVDFFDYQSAFLFFERSES